MDSATLAPQQAAQGSGRDRDPIKPWFQAAEQLGDYVGIRFGRIAPGKASPEWFYRSHADYDGIGGFAELLRNSGAKVDALPTIPHTIKQTWGPFIRSLPEYLQPRDRVIWNRSFQVTATPIADCPPAAIAWYVFDEATTARIKNHCRENGYTVNSFLLKNLSAAIFPDLAAKSKTIPWMVPVNLRGKVDRERDTENHVSYVRVTVARDDDSSAVHAKIYDALEKGAHWANWNAYTALRFTPLAMKRGIIKIERATSQWLIGAFSNLGEWDKDRKLSGNGIDGDWLFTPPAMRFFKIASGCVTWRGRLSLCLQIHPQLSANPGDARAWIDAWQELIQSDIGGDAERERIAQ
jgi:hypothetical protein